VYEIVSKTLLEILFGGNVKNWELLQSIGTWSKTLMSRFRMLPQQSLHAQLELSLAVYKISPESP
jgi:hypothetical protein